MKFVLLALAMATASVPALAENRIATRTTVEGEDRQQYFLFPSPAEAPKEGYKLLVILPGGNGNEGFREFGRDLASSGTGDDYLVAQLVSIRWSPEQGVIWPTRASAVKGAEFTTEEYLSAVIKDIRANHRVDSEHVYTLAWSSAGPAAYAASLEISAIKGSFIAMSVFQPSGLASLSKAKGQRYFLYHSPEDRVCPFHMSEEARDLLGEKGAEVKLEPYEGGHGWHGKTFTDVRRGLDWLEKR